ncbi:unnamed protein product [Ambrosiozyma monospora]|uniref:Unnamed protein product n=1 Tax=Ambrosiozyma monospora TaxID=43982 RepID=A0A9W6YXB2_AMBMO|nr:unnamed protein product [Ambrosiozyma monospora]
MPSPPANQAPVIQDSEAAGLLMLFSHQSSTSTDHSSHSHSHSHSQSQNSPLSHENLQQQQQLLQQQQQQQQQHKRQRSRSSRHPSNGSNISSGSTQATDVLERPKSRSNKSSKSASPSNGHAMLHSNSGSSRLSPPLRHPHQSLPHTQPVSTTSPGPAAAALASDSRSNRAMVAAAALAAAAATPLPLQQRHIPHQHHSQNQTINSNSSSAAPSQPRTPEALADSTFRKGEKIEKDTNHSPAHPKNVTSPKPEVKTLNDSEVVKTTDSAETIILNQQPSLQKPTSPKPQEDPQKLKVDSSVKPPDPVPQPLVPQKRKRDQTETTTTNPDGSTTKTKTVKIASPSKKAKREHSGSTNQGSSRPSSPSNGTDSSSQQPPLPPPSYGVDPDAGVIGCICGYDHDDGFTIQCDRCFRWQHAVCMNIKDIDDVPDNYLCYLCDPESKIDASRAQKLQEARLQPKRRKSSNSNVSTTGNDNSTTNDESSSSTSNGNNNKSNSNHNHSKSGTPSAGSGSGSGSSGKSKRKKNDDSNSDAADGLERYQTLYFNIDRLEFKTSSVKSLVDKLPKLIKQRPEVLKFTNEAEMKSQFVNPKTHLVVKSAPENPKAKFTGISKLGLFAGKLLKSGQLVDEMVGELDVKQDYIEEPCNQYWLLVVSTKL